jgi:hypothetical protein
MLINQECARPAMNAKILAKRTRAAIKQRGKLGTQKRRLSAEIRGQKPAS